MTDDGHSPPHEGAGNWWSRLDQEINLQGGLTPSEKAQLRRMQRWSKSARFPEGALLKEARADLDKATRKVAEQAKISPTWWQQIERGTKKAGDGQLIEVRAPADTLARMAQVVGISPRQLEFVERADAAKELEELNAMNVVGLKNAFLRQVPGDASSEASENMLNLIRREDNKAEAFSRLPTKVQKLLKGGDVIDLDILQSDEADDISVISLVVRQDLDEPPTSEERYAALKVTGRWALISDLVRTAWESDALDSVTPSRLMDAFKKALEGYDPFDEVKALSNAKPIKGVPAGGRYSVRKDSEGKFRFVLQGNNGTVVAASKGYSTLTEALKVFGPAQESSTDDPWATDSESSKGGFGGGFGGGFSDDPPF